MRHVTTEAFKNTNLHKSNFATLIQCCWINETVTGSKIYTADGNLVIISNEPTEIAVYNITGQMVLMQKVEAGKTIVNDIPHGVYIVNGQKIIL